MATYIVMCGFRAHVIRPRGVPNPVDNMINTSPRTTADATHEKMIYVNILCNRCFNPVLATKTLEEEVAMHANPFGGRGRNGIVDPVTREVRACDCESRDPDWERL
jgi:hypothetical protein